METRLKRVRALGLEGMYAAAEWLQRSSVLCCVILATCLLPLALLEAHTNHFTADEVYTLRIAQQPTWRAMITLSREVDLHPPLHYVAQRLALNPGLPPWLASRLPSILASLAALLAVFLTARRRLGNCAGMIAAATMWFTPVTDFAWQNRPYALWIGCTALTILCWQRVLEAKGRSLAIWLTCAALGTWCMALTHFFGLACVGVLFVATLVEGVVRRRVNWPVLAVLASPAFAALTYARQSAGMKPNTFPPSYLPSWSLAASIYTDLLLIAGAVLLGCCLLGFLLRSTAKQEPHLRHDTQLSLTLAAAGLMLLPAALLIAAAWQHAQFFARYGLSAALGLALLAPWVGQRVAKDLRLVGVLMTLALIIAAVVRTSDASFEVFGEWRAAAHNGGAAPLRLESLDPKLPVVAAWALVFTQMNDRAAPAVLDRTYYLTDFDAARQFSGATLFENEDRVAALLHFRGKTAPLPQFLSANRSFYMIADTTNVEEWLPKKLAADGAQVKRLGKFVSTYYDDDLYLVTLPPPAR